MLDRKEIEFGIIHFLCMYCNNNDSQIIVYTYIYFSQEIILLIIICIGSIFNSHVITLETIIDVYKQIKNDIGIT